MASRRRIRQRFALASRAAHNHRLRRHPALEVLEPRVVLSTFTVNLTTDTAPTTGGSGSGIAGDLRYCITQTDANNQANQIVFDSTVFGTHQTITLGGSFLELMDTGGTQTITGPAAGVTISGGQKSRDFQVDANVTASLSGLTITGGSANVGGGVLNDFGNVTLTDCTVSGNSAGYGGGVLNDFGNVTLTDCTVSGNSAAVYGGGIENDDGTLTATNSTVSGNSAAKGGGIYSAGTATLTGTTVSGNSAVDGGGIEIVSGSLTITTTAISGNKAQGGAGKDGAEGALGTSGESGIGFLFPHKGGNGGNGGAGGDAGNAAGGGLYVTSGTVDLTDSTLSDNTAAGGAGGSGGAGGGGGYGGHGTFGGPSSRGLPHSDGFSGGKGGTGGTGGTGGEGLGGGLYVRGGTLSVLNTTFAGNEANGGAGGAGGRGGRGGRGGTAISTGNGNYKDVGGTGGDAGGAGAGGEGGEGDGGGLYLAGGTVTIQYTTIAKDQTSRGQAGLGGTGAQGGKGGAGNPTGRDGAASSNGPSGKVGSSGVGGIEPNILAELDNTIVATNTADGQSSDVDNELDPNSSNNLFGTGGSGGLEFNPISGNFLGNIFNVANPGLAPLGDYGGPTQTVALLHGSPAIGRGTTVAGLTADQRGFELDSPRPDIGAFQTNPLVVNTTSDGAGSLPGDLDLRQAVNLADVIGTAATITFDPTVFAAHQTIALTGGQLELSDTGGLLTIDGPAAGLTIDAGGMSDVFQVDGGATAALSGLTITGGSVSQGFGGGLENFGTVTLTDCTVSGNSAFVGGGVYNYGTATLTDCTISGNSARLGGGGLWNVGTATFTDCTISGNSALGAGGVYNNGIATLTLVDCTISGNSAQYGGGLFNYGIATITDCTISGNSATRIGGVVIADGADGRFWKPLTTIVDTIVAGNAAGSGPDVVGVVSTDEGYNLIGDGDGGSGFTAAGDQVGSAASPIDPRLAPLGDYGGPTQTMALRTGSPAIGKGVAIPGLTTDQRGFALNAPRPDIGAFQSTLVVSTTTDAGYGLLSLSGELSLRQAVGLADFLGGTQTITFDPAAFATTQTIALTGGQLELSDTGGLLTIDGPAAGLTIDAGGMSDVFQVDGGATAALSGLTITGGSAVLSGGLVNLGTITLTDCTISGNSAIAFGGVYNDGTATLIDCTISGNSAQYGGGLFNFGIATITDCTISGNSATRIGGGLWNDGTATFTDCTISGNAAIEGGGVYLLSGSNSRTTIVDTIVAGNVAITGPDLLGTIDQDQGYNLIGDGEGADGFTAAGDQVGSAASPIDPRLAPLGDYGGPTQTMALLHGSPAIGRGTTVAGLTADQRGFALDSPRPDIGAFQTNPLVVNTTSDGAGSLLGDLDLRQAVNLADVIGTAATITFDPTVFAAHQTIALTGGQLELSDAGGLETITGPAAGLTIDAGGESGVFLVDRGVTAALAGLTITGGSARDGGLANAGTITLIDCTISGNSATFGGGVYNDGAATLIDCTISGNSAEDGGGMFNDGAATLTDCTISGNSAEDGGGMFNYGTTTLTGCTLSGNSAGEGGGLWNDGTATFTDCTISGNSAGEGGGLSNDGTATFTDCTISGNSADEGGGLSNDGTATFTDCTISGNSAGEGGGLSNDGTATFTDCTISGNSADEGGGVYLPNVPAARTTIVDTIVAGNSAGTGPDVSGTVTDDRGDNLIGDGDGAGGFTAAGDQVGSAASPIDPRLAPLGDYGGPTQTMPLRSGSPAIGRGTTVAGLTADQRGFALDSPRPDIGAFQTNPLVVNTTSDGAGSLPGDLDLRQAVNLADVIGTAATITFDPTVFAAHQTIALTGGQLELSDAGGLETITGPAAGLTIDAGGESGVFLVDRGVTAALAGLTITGGSARDGGLANAGTITLIDCTLSGNSATFGGGVYNDGAATLIDCTISGNSAEDGGGMFNYGTTTLIDCTISGNSAKRTGGGLWNDGTATITDCTISGNSANEGGGVILLGGSRATIGDTIVAGNTASSAPDFSGAVSTDKGYNLIGDGDGDGGFTAAGDQVGSAASPIDPELAPLGDYGGPTRTMALRAGSLAIGRGTSVAGLTTDQRGFALDSPRPDIGSFQFQTNPLVVNTTGDAPGSPPGGLDLREAVNLADVTRTAATITFDPNVFATHQTIALTTGQLELSDTGGTQTIAGPAAGLTIDAGGTSRVFVVDGGATAALSGLTITGGSVPRGLGGGLENFGTVTLTDCTVSGNSASLGLGGGLWNDGTATLTGCTVSGNSAYEGGGVYNYGTATLTDSTISGNSASERGGGLWNYGTATLADCTISGNSTNEGGGVYLLSGANSRTTIVDTIVAGNSAGTGPDVSGTVTDDQGSNLIGDRDGAGGFTAAGDQVGSAASPIDPLLAPLGDYGGPTQTMALRAGSPAIGRGTTIAGLTADQRGFALDSPRPDIGAFQSDPLVVNTTSDGAGSLPGDLDLRQAVNLADVIGTAATITFDPTVFAAPQTVALTGGQLELSDAGGLETITGPAAGLSIDAGGTSRVFVVDGGVTAALSGLTITGGSTTTGGGLVNLGTITLTDCTISGNSAIFGGGVYNYGTATFTDCTISGNSAGYGGGVNAYGPLTLTACTVSGNSAAIGGGVILHGGADSRTTIGDTIVAGNAAIISPDLFGTVDQDRGSNLIGDGDGASGFTAAGDQVGSAASPIDPLLAPLGDYGGPTRTMPLRSGSPAIGKGVAVAGLTADQRGFALDSPQPDIGAFQTNPLVVNTTSDGTGSLPGDLDLRQAVNLANVIGAATTITFDPTIFAAHQMIRLTAGPLELSDTSGLETITGPAAGLTIDAGGTSRVFVVDGGATAALSGLTITGGSVPRGLGGGLENFGTVTLTDCTVSGNSASLGLGGGLWNDGTATLTGCTVSGNSAYEGGGVYNYGTATLTDSTISGNSASERGGGLWNYGTATLADCTISGNSTNEGGGVYLLSGANSRTTIVDTIVAGNSAGTGPDVSGTVTDDQGSNLIGDRDGAGGFTAAGDQVGSAASPIDPLLAPLGDYGGPTQTMALRAGSPAIGRGTTIAGLTADQRGFALDSPRPDIGAFQSDPLVVNTTSDGAGSLPGDLDLRQAVNLADVIGTAATITFDPTVFAAHQTIRLTAGQLELSDAGGLETITGPAAGLTIDAGGTSRVFVVDGGATAALSGLTITGGSVPRGFGGGLENLGTVTLTDCTISGNSASLGLGGGLANEGTATLVDCTINGNSAGDGGGVYNNATATLTDCTISGNSAHEDGGAVYNYGTATLTDCTISGNSANEGGGVEVVGSEPSSVLTLTACTVSGNSASTEGGGINVYEDFAVAAVTIGDTIVAGNTASSAPDFSGAVSTDLGYNLIGDGDGASGFTAAGDQVGSAASPIDPLLAPLGDYGGPTQTMALLPGSPAIHAGSANIPGVTIPTTDQRGESRTGGVDIGAFESQGFTLTPVAGSTPQSAFINTAFTNALAVTVTANNAVEPVEGGVVTFTAPAGASAALSAGTATIAGGQALITATAGATPGSYTVTASASGSPGTTFSLANITPIAISPSSVPDATAGSSYNEPLTASGGIGGPFTFAVTAGALPSGFTLASDGTLSGTSTLAATASFTITATGAGGYYGSQAYSLTVDPASASQLVIDIQPAGPAVVGQPFATQPVVYLEDPYHNLETGDNTTTVTAGLAVGSGPLLGTTTVTVSGGIATFAGLADASAESLKLSFTGGAITQAVSNPITVSPAATTTSVATNGSPSVFGQSVTFTATVGVTAPGAGTPTGTVTFMDGTNTLGTGTLDGSGTATYLTTSLSVSTHTITAVYAGNGNFTKSTSSALSQFVNKDGTTAVVVSSANPSVLNQAIGFTVTVAAAAPGSGTPTGTVQFQVDGKNFGSVVTLVGGTATSGSTTTLKVGNHTVTAVYGGDAHFTTSTAPTLTQVVNPDATTTTLAASVNPSVFGQSVTFTATVAAVAPGSGTPTGSVTFYDGSTALKTASLSGGSTTFTTTALATASHAITAVYNGNATLATSTSSVLSETVNPDGSTAVVTSSADPSVFGQSVTLTATVTANAPGGGKPTGSVTFLDGTSTLGTATLSGGTATLKTGALAPGTDAITVRYGGDGNFLASTSAILNQVVNPDATTTALKSSKDPSVYGQSVTFTATVKAAAPGSGTPTGSVTFLDGGNPIGTVALNGSGVATFATSSLSTGSQSITAVYSGDADFTTSTSAALTQTVNQDATATKLKSSNSPSVYGQTVTFTATVTASSPGGGTPTGSVAFYDGTTALATESLNGGTTTYSTSSLSVGAHAITAVYSGDGNFTTSTSAAVNQGVNQDKTSTALSSSVNPATIGQSVTFTATVAASAPGSGTPTGTVTFDDGTTALATVTLSGGTASYSTAALSVGTHSIAAVYNGDPDLITSKSSVLKETIRSAASPSIAASEDVVVMAVIEPASSSGSIPVASGSTGGPPDAPDAVSLALEALSDVASDAELIRDVAERGMSSKGARPGLFRLG